MAAADAVTTQMEGYRQSDTVVTHCAVADYNRAERGIIMKKTDIHKLCMAAFLTALAVVGSQFIQFPFLGATCSPTQHFVNILAGVYLGPWWAMGTGFCAALIRNIAGLGSPLAFPGSMIGAFLAGAMFHWIFMKNSLAVRLPAAYVGELFGTSVLGGLCAFPIAVFIMGKEASLFGYIFPFFVSCVVGTVAAAVLVTAMKRTRVLDKFFIDEHKKASVKTE